MKIAMIVTGLAPERTGGAEWASLKCSEALASLGVEVHILTPFWNGKRTERENHANLRFHYLNDIRPDVRFGYTLGMKRFARLCRRKVREINPDLVHGWTLFPPAEIAASSARSMRRLPSGRSPFIIGCRSFIDVVNVNQVTLGKSPSIVNRILDVNEYRKRMQLFSNAGGITAQTAFMSGQIFSVHGRESAIIPNGLDSQAFELPGKREELRSKWGLSGKVIVNVGRHSPVKGLNYLISSAPLILDRHPDSMIVMVGDGRIHDDLRNRAKDVLPDHPDSILFTGKLYRESTREVLGASDIFAFPALIEGFPNAILEAFAVGLPVACSPLASLPEIVEDGKNGSIAESPDKIGEAILRLLDDPSGLKKMKMGENREDASGILRRTP